MTAAHLAASAPALEPVGEFFESLWSEVAQRFVVHIGYAALLGGAVAWLYLHATRFRPRTPGLATTLLFLAMLIAMMTLAIGDNSARAFTLVGTLAIVRFRTAVRDVRDTIFVIFAVAEGLAAGAANPLLGIVGTVFIGIVMLVLGRFGNSERDGSEDFDPSARLSLRYASSPPTQTEIETILASHARAFRLLSTRTDGNGGDARLFFSLDIERSKATDLVQSLHGHASLKRAMVTFDEIDPDDD